MPKALKIMGLLYFVGSLSGGSSFAQTPSESHVSVTGAIFAQDSSNPKLGEAYVDPRGLVWSEVSRNDDDLQIKKIIDAWLFAEMAVARIGAQSIYILAPNIRVG